MIKGEAGINEWSKVRQDLVFKWFWLAFGIEKRSWRKLQNNGEIDFTIMVNQACDLNLNVILTLHLTCRLNWNILVKSLNLVLTFMLELKRLWCVLFSPCWLVLWTAGGASVSPVANATLHKVLAALQDGKQLHLQDLRLNYSSTLASLLDQNVPGKKRLGIYSMACPTEGIPVSSDWFWWHQHRNYV